MLTRFSALLGNLKQLRQGEICDCFRYLRIMYFCFLVITFTMDILVVFPSSSIIRVLKIICQSLIFLPHQVLHTSLARDGEDSDHQLVDSVGAGGHGLRVLIDGVDVVLVGVVVVIVQVVVDVGHKVVYEEHEGHEVE